MMTLIILTFESLRRQIILPRIPKISISVADRDLHIRGGPVIHTLMGGGGGLKTDFFRLFGPQFGLKIRVGGPLRWIRH